MICSSENSIKNGRGFHRGNLARQGIGLGWQGTRFPLDPLTPCKTFQNNKISETLSFGENPWNYTVEENDSETSEACLWDKFPEGILTLRTKSIAFKGQWTLFWRAWVKFQRLMPLKIYRQIFKMICLFFQRLMAFKISRVFFQMHWLWK